MSWDDLLKKARTAVSTLGATYSERLETELKEIEKQGANDYWVGLQQEGAKFEENKNGLVLPWLLGITNVDPMENKIDHIWEYQPDFPDIDIDFLPIARASLKKYAAKKYGEDHICSVGNWITYKPKSALQDACRALSGDSEVQSETIRTTTVLPDEFDNLSPGDLARIRKSARLTVEDIMAKEKEKDKKDRREMSEIEKELANNRREATKYEPFFDYYVKHVDIVKIAYKMVGMIKAQGTHAGGIIISSETLGDIMPMSRMKDGWTSQWTEGRNTQLSKFGLIKFDLLGLKTMYYIWKCCKFIEQNKGARIDWSDMDPENGRLGWVYAGKRRAPIKMNDPESMAAITDLKTESIFQHETAIQKGIIEKGGVRDFWDMVIYSSLGRPGPMDEIPNYLLKRDKKIDWKEGEYIDGDIIWDGEKYIYNPSDLKKGDPEDPRIINILDETHGTIVFQEQLTAIWQILARFTVPQAEESRKIISKKWEHLLPRVRERWMNGATKEIGKEKAEKWWGIMHNFGRYAFNRSHGVAYSVISFRCLFLKTHFPAEWWAAVMSICHPDKLKKYMAAAQSEGVKLTTLDVDNLTVGFTVIDDSVTPGLLSIKGIGEKAANKITEVKGPFSSVDDFVERVGKSKGSMERIIKLGAFDKICPNRRGLWEWYRYKYCAGKEITDLRGMIDEKFAWPQDKVEEERQRQTNEYFKLYPNRKKIPTKIEKWKPKIGRRFDVPSRDDVINLFPDYTLAEKIESEKLFLGYLLTSPMEMYKGTDNTIEEAKFSGILESVIEDIEIRKSKKGNEYIVLHMTDGKDRAKVTVWADIFAATDSKIIRAGVGVRIPVKWNDRYRNFSIASGGQIIRLTLAGELNEEDEL